MIFAPMRLVGLACWCPSRTLRCWSRLVRLVTSIESRALGAHLDLCSFYIFFIYFSNFLIYFFLHLRRDMESMLVVRLVVISSSILTPAPHSIPLCSLQYLDYLIEESLL